MLDICDEYARDHALVFNNKKSVSITFVKNKRIALKCPELWLNGSILPSKSEIVHLGVVMDRGCGDQAAVERRVRRFYGAVNSVVSRLGGVCTNDRVWLNIVEKALFPVLNYGSHLWNFSRSSVTKAVNNAYRKGVRRGLGMAQRDSLCQRIAGFEEADVKMKRSQLRFMKRATESQNRLVGSMSWHVYRHSCDVNEEMNIFSTRYIDI